MVDLQELFIEELYNQIPRRAELVNRLVEILHIEKDCVSRRLSGRVNFSIREMGIIALKMDILLDKLLRIDQDKMPQYWVPVVLTSPMKGRSLNELCQTLCSTLDRACQIAQAPANIGFVYSSLPIEYYIHSEVLSKFMFFKWGYHFEGTEAYNDYSRWEVPREIVTLREKVDTLFERIGSGFGIWDNSMIFSLASDVSYLHKIKVISEKDKDLIKDELKQILARIEVSLFGIDTDENPIASKMCHFISSMSMGFNCSFIESEENCMVLYYTNFCFVLTENTRYRVSAVKEWMQSLQKVSTLITSSGRTERRLFFQRQQKIIDLLLE